MWKISDARDSWETDTGRDLLASIVVSAQIRLTFGFGFRPKVPLYFRWHIRFRPNVIRHFRLTFGYGRKWNFYFRSTSIIIITVKCLHIHILDAGKWNLASCLSKCCTAVSDMTTSVVNNCPTQLQNSPTFNSTQLLSDGNIADLQESCRLVRLRNLWKVAHNTWFSKNIHIVLYNITFSLSNTFSRNNLVKVKYNCRKWCLTKFGLYCEVCEPQ